MNRIETCIQAGQRLTAGSHIGKRVHIGDRGSAGEPPPLLDASIESGAVLAIRNRRLKILVVDDHESFRAGLASELRDHYGAEVEEEGSGEGALRLAHNGFDLIIMDIKMPIIDGLDACAEICQSSLGIQVVLMTAELNEEQRRKAQAFSVPVLAKPIEFEALEEILLACAGRAAS